MQCLQAVRLIQLPPQPHLSWAHLQVTRASLWCRSLQAMLLTHYHQAFVKLQAELEREGMVVALGSADPDGKQR